MSFAPYTQNAPSYYAIQWLNGTNGGLDLADFLAMFPGEDPSQYSVDADQNLVWIPTYPYEQVYNYGTWFVCGPLYGDQEPPDTITHFGSLQLTSDQFTQQFTAVS